MPDDLIRLSIQGDASGAVDSVGQVSTAAKGLATDLKGVGQAGEVAGNEISAGMEKANFSMQEARHGAMLLSEELGVKLPRSLAMVVAHSETFGAVFAAAFSTVAVVGFLELAEQMGEKLAAAATKAFIFTDAMKTLDSQLMADNKTIIELNAKTKELGREFDEAGLKGGKLAQTKLSFQMDDAAEVGEQIRNVERQLDALKDKAETGYWQFGKKLFFGTPTDQETQVNALESTLGVLQQKQKEMTAQTAVDMERTHAAIEKDDAEAAKKAAELAQKQMEMRLKMDEAIIKAHQSLNKQLQADEKQTDEQGSLRLQMQLDGQSKIDESIDKRYEAQLTLNEAEASAAVSTQESVVNKDKAARHVAQETVDTQKLVQLLQQERDAELAIVDAKMSAASTQMEVSHGAGDTAGFNDALASYTQFQAERIRVNAQANEKIANANNNVLKQETKAVDSYLKQFNQEFANGFAKALVSGQSFGKSMSQMWKNVETSAVQSFARIALLMVEQLALAELTGNKEKLMAAKTAAAKQFKAYSDIPEPVPAIAAAAAFATVMAFEQGGIVPSGGPDEDRHVSLLRPNEMVLPPDLSQKVQDMAARPGSGGGGGQVIHIHAMDAADVKRLFMKHSSALGAGMHKATSDGHFNINKAARGK